MKILLSSYCFSPSVGGIETASEVLATEFVRAGHEVRLITQTAKPDVREWPFEVFRTPSAGLLFSLVRWCDLFFHNAISLKTAWPLLFIRRPWVVSHQMWVARLDRGLGWQDRLKRFLLRFSTNVSVSRAMAADLQVPSVVIGNPYRDKIFMRRDVGARNKELVFLGRLVSDKGADLLLTALGILRREGIVPSLTVIGSGPEEPALRLQARELGLSGQVEFAGSQTGAPLAELLNRHKILVVPSRFHEPFGIVALEGIACGCAVVGSAEGGLPDAIGPCGLTFPNGDAVALAAALRKLLIEGCSGEGASAHLAKHTAKAVAAAYLAVFKKAARKEVVKRLLIYSPQMVLYGGMERHICLLARECARNGFEVRLVTTSNSLHPDIKRGLVECGIRLHELGIASGKAPILLKIAWLLFTAIRMRFIRWGVIYTNGQSGLVPLLWIAARRGARRVHHHHTSASSVEQAGWHWLYKWTLVSVPEIIACSETTKAAIQQACNRSDVVFLPYITPSLAKAVEIKDKVYSPDSILHFGYFGRLSPSKGIDEICQLSDALAASGIRWHIYGAGDAYPESRFSNYPALTYHGLCLEQEAYAKALRGMDAVALFSRHSEGMPLSLIEAMSLGLPWIATDRGGVRELASGKENSILIPADASIDDIKRLVEELAARIRACGTSREAQRRFYDERFAPERVASKWIEFFTAAHREAQLTNPPAPSNG